MRFSLFQIARDTAFQPELKSVRPSLAHTLAITSPGSYSMNRVETFRSDWLWFVSLPLLLIGAAGTLMRSFDKFVALKVCPLDSFRPVAMHDAIDHHIGARQIRDRFKDGLIFQHCEDAREVDFQSRREAVVDVKGNTSLVSFPHQQDILVNRGGPAHSRVVDVWWLSGRRGHDIKVLWRIGIQTRAREQDRFPVALRAPGQQEMSRGIRKHREGPDQHNREQRAGPPRRGKSP